MLAIILVIRLLLLYSVCPYSPSLTTFMPKLLPTTPSHVHASPASLVHCAVAVAPTFKHVTEADIGAAATAARVITKNFILFAAFLRNHVAHRVFRENTRFATCDEETWSNIRTYGV